MPIFSIMRTIPLSIVKYVHAWWMSELILTYLHVDHHGLLMSWGGHPRHYGLLNLETNKDAIEQIPFLEGLIPANHTEIIEFIQVGNGRTAHVHLVPFRCGTWVLLFDATAEHDRQQQLQQQLNELSILNYRQTRLLQELETVAKNLQSDKQHLEEIAKNKGSLLSNLSHELRTPLTSIASYSHYLEENKDHQDYVSNVKYNANHLLALIDNILDQTQLESGKISLQASNCDPRQLLNELKAIFAPLAREKHLKLELQATPQLPFVLVLDELRLRQILINLLNNALKYTQCGFIRLILGWEQGRLTFEVIDSGEGISSDALERIFLPYHRETNKQTGVGLGLAITRQLIELMNGEIHVKSTLNEGTTFSGFISTVPKQEQDDEEDYLPSKNTTVLLVEDTRSVHLLLATYLKESGYTVLSAYNGAEAVALAESEKPNIVLMDMQMPIMDGYAATRTLRERHFEKPIIALSASDLLEDREAAIIAGCTHYLRKPISPEMLLSIIKAVLKQ